jgi:PHD/YefM family antitoxin component YafN of YafNO toxin-antitoxin module
MLTLHPNILNKDGKKEFVVLSYEEYLQIQEELEKYEDLKEIRAAMERDANMPRVSLEEARKLVGI